MNPLRLYGMAAVVGTAMLLSGVPAFAQQGPQDCNWKKYLYVQDAYNRARSTLACSIR
jgi:hypothetical protein